MERWVAAEGREGEVIFPQLEKLFVRGCPKLATLPETPNLKVVELYEDKAQLSLQILTHRYMFTLSNLELYVRDKEAALELDDEDNVESPLLELSLDGCNFLFLPSPSQPAIGIWRCFGKLVSLAIYSCDALIYWPKEVFQSLVSLKYLDVSRCNNLVGPTLVKGEPAPPTTSQALPHLDTLFVDGCEKLTELFVLPASIRQLRIWNCKNMKFKLEEDTDSKNVHVGQLDTSTSLENCASTSVPKQSPAQTNLPLPCLEWLSIESCDNLVALALALANLAPALQFLEIISCPKLCSLSGQLDALKFLFIDGCNKLQSLDSLGHLPSLEILSLVRCKCLTSVPGVLGSYSALQELYIRYCPAIDMKPLYKRHQQRLDRLEERDLSHAHSSDPKEGSKILEICCPWMSALLKSHKQRYTRHKSMEKTIGRRGAEQGRAGCAALVRQRTCRLGLGRYGLLRRASVNCDKLLITAGEDRRSSSSVHTTCRVQRTEQSSRRLIMSLCVHGSTGRLERWRTQPTIAWCHGDVFVRVLE